MNGLNPSDIREMRHALGWSARELGELFDRTAVTIYHWENGKTTPGSNVTALLKALQSEIIRRDDRESDSELQQWSDDLLERGPDALLERRSHQRGQVDAVSSLEEIVHIANEHGGMIIRGKSGEALAYIVPHTTEGLLRWARNLLETATKDAYLSDQPSDHVNQRDDRKVSASIS